MELIVRDPVCGELILWEKAAAVLSHHGAFHYFCSVRCSKRFQHAPSRFALKQTSVIGRTLEPLLLGYAIFYYYYEKGS